MTEEVMTEAPPSNNSRDSKGNLSYASIRPLLILWVILSYLILYVRPRQNTFYTIHDFFVHHLTNF